MSDQKPQYKTIKIVSKEEKKTKSGTNTRIFIIDQDGVKYVFNKFKADGNSTQAASQFKTMGLDEGMVTNIGFVTETYTIDGRGLTENKIIGMREDNTPPTAIQGNPQSQPQKPRSEAPTRSQGHSDDFSRRLGVQGHINALLSNPNVYAGEVETIPGSRITQIVKTAIEIEDEAERQLSPGYQAWQQSVPKQELPTVEEGQPTPEDFDSLAESIPF